MIEFKNVSKIYKAKKGVETKALNNINLKIDNKGMVFIVGKSGSGKSTMLNLLGGLDTVTTGQLLINGKNISKFKNKEYDSYRNTYIGFIFQEFNILEEYNVYENIELALRLQNKKPTKEEIDSLLKKLDIENLGQRKVNELSGGQKQRVAIARALIKNPKIILADEPTGNLDQTSSKQIFNLLKEISKEKLVIVVSHDMESANTYADRIIEISDGNITNDTKSETEVTEEKLELKKSKLPFSYSIKMAIRNLKIKPLKLFMTCILTAMALVFIGFTTNLLFFNPTSLIIDIMKNNNEYTYEIYKREWLPEGAIIRKSLTEEDINKVRKITNSKLNIEYELYDNNTPLSLTLGQDKQINNLTFIETDNKDEINVIGKYPKNDREILINKNLAESIIKYGILDSNNQLYYPKTIDELINSNHQIKLGDNKVIISGIVDNSINQNETNKEIFEKYINKNNVIYVNGFTKTASLNTNKEEILKYIMISKEHSETDIHSQTIFNLKTLKEKTQIITKNGIETKSSINKNEVILSLNDLENMDINYKSGLEKYIQNHKESNYIESVKNYTMQYLKENQLENINLIIAPTKTQKQEIIKVNIIGVTLDNSSYISNNYVLEYSPVSKIATNISIYDNNTQNLKHVFNILPYAGLMDKLAGTYLEYKVPHEKEINNVISRYKKVDIYILIVSIVFIIFAVLLFSNFIGVSISYSKKEIGILRALGARSKDTLKIFTYESLIISIISLIISIIGFNITCDILNQSLNQKYDFILNPIVKSPITPLLLLIFVIIITLIITFISLSRVNRIKPIDAILNK